MNLPWLWKLTFSASRMLMLANTIECCLCKMVHKMSKLMSIGWRGNILPCLSLYYSTYANGSRYIELCCDFGTGRFFPSHSELLYWHQGHNMMSLILLAEAWGIWIEFSRESNNNTATKQNTTRPCSHFKQHIVHSYGTSFSVESRRHNS